MALIEGHIEDNGDVGGEDDDIVGDHITTPHTITDYPTR